MLSDSCEKNLANGFNNLKIDKQFFISQKTKILKKNMLSPFNNQSINQCFKSTKNEIDSCLKKKVLCSTLLEDKIINNENHFSPLKNEKRVQKVIKSKSHRYISLVDKRIENIDLDDINRLKKCFIEERVEYNRKKAFQSYLSIVEKRKNLQLVSNQLITDRNNIEGLLLRKKEIESSTPRRAFIDLIEAKLGFKNQHRTDKTINGNSSLFKKTDASKIKQISEFLQLNQKIDQKCNIGKSTRVSNLESKLDQNETENMIEENKNSNVQKLKSIQKEIFHKFFHKNQNSSEILKIKEDKYVKIDSNIGEDHSILQSNMQKLEKKLKINIFKKSVIFSENVNSEIKTSQSKKDIKEYIKYSKCDEIEKECDIISKPEKILQSLLYQEIDQFQKNLKITKKYEFETLYPNIKLIQRMNFLEKH